MLLLFVSIACATMLIPSYSAVKVEFGIPESLIAIPDAFFILISALFSLIWGYYTDRIDRTKVIMAGAFSWTIGMLLTAFSLNYTMLISSRMLSGAGLGCVLPVGYSIIADAIPPDERSGWFGILAILSSISNGIGQALSSFIGPILGWRFPFLLLSGISIFIVFLLFFIKIPKRGASEDELLDLTQLNLEYSYKIAKKDLSKIIKKRTNRYLIAQNFFSIIPGTIIIYFLTSMLNLHYLYELPQEIRLQTATILAGILGIGYILGNLILSRLGDILYRKNKKNRTRLATICLTLSVPFFIITLLMVKPVHISMLDITYPDPIATAEITKYIFATIVGIFSKYPNFIYYFIFGLVGTILSAGPVANRNAVMIDINLPEHRGTSVSFLNLSEQVGKGLTLLISYLLITLLGGIYNMMLFSAILWIPAIILWIFANKTVGKDLALKSMILSERMQVGLIDYIFELEIQMDRAIQKIQDSKYYLYNNPEKFDKLVGEAIKIFRKIERASEFRSITNIIEKAKELNVKATVIKKMTKQIFKIIKEEKDISIQERELLEQDLRQIELMINEGEKSTFGQLQIYYEDAYLKMIEARLLRKNNITQSFDKILEAIKIYERVKNLLNERLDETLDESKFTEEDKTVLQKEKDLFNKCSNALLATRRLKSEFEGIMSQLREKGIKEEDLIKITELAREYNLDFNKILMETFGQDAKVIKDFIKITDKIDKIFDEYDKWKETNLTVF